MVSRSRLSAECVVVVALWGDIYIKADVEQHLGNRNNSQNLTLTKSEPLPLPDQTNQAIKQIKSHTRVFTQSQRPEKKENFCINCTQSMVEVESRVSARINRGVLMPSADD